MTILYLSHCAKDMANAAFVTNNRDLAEEAIKTQRQIGPLEHHYRVLHINRIRMGRLKSVETDALHLDLINTFLHISEHVRNICFEIAGRDRGVDSSSAEGENQDRKCQD